jgi:tetratricopeptide (TPR) repeat protein
VTPGWVLAVLMAGLDICGEALDPTPSPDPALAEDYLAVARGELALGQLLTAAAAFADAVRHDPSLEEARSGLENACAKLRREEVVRRTSALLSKGDAAAAQKLLEALPDPQADPSLALLLGMARYKAGDVEGASQALERAMTDASLAPSAALYRGLSELALGRRRSAITQLQLAATSTDERIRRSASELRRAAQRAGPASVSIALGGGYDSNVELAPGTGLGPSGSSDAMGTAQVAISAQPLGATGPYARAAGSYRKHRELRSYDLGHAAVALGASFKHGVWLGGADVAVDGLSFGEQPYVLAYGPALRAGADWGQWTLLASHALRFERFWSDALRGFDGSRHQGSLSGSWRPAPGVQLGVDYRLSTLAASEPSSSYLEHGPGATLILRPFQRLRLGARAETAFRNHEALDASFGLVRSDRYLDLDAWADVELWDRWMLTARIDARGARSNVAPLEHERIAGSVLISWTTGLF